MVRSVQRESSFLPSSAAAQSNTSHPRMKRKSSSKARYYPPLTPLKPPPHPQPKPILPVPTETNPFPVHSRPQVHRLIAPRDQKHQSNFVEFRSLKIVYRRYAGLFFCVCVDANDNELAYLEAIHFFVEVLDSFFGNVCELDLVFNFYKVGGSVRWFVSFSGVGRRGGGKIKVSIAVADG